MIMKATQPVHSSNNFSTPGDLPAYEFSVAIASRCIAAHRRPPEAFKLGRLEQSSGFFPAFRTCFRSTRPRLPRRFQARCPLSLGRTIVLWVP